MDEATIWQVIESGRIALADQLEPLTDEQWATPSLCTAWAVKDVLAHLVPYPVSWSRFAVAMLVSRGSFARANLRLTAHVAAQPTADLLADLRRLAGGRFAPPGMGPRAPLTELFVHGQDIRVPLGLPDPGPADAWPAVLEFLVTPKAKRGYVDQGLPIARWVAEDAGWAYGDGPEVRGPATALALTICGRGARLAELSGPGVPIVTRWLADLQAMRA